MTAWPDTTRLPAPTDPYEVALWLLGRHPQLAELVDRIPGAVKGQAVDMWVVGDAVRDLDGYREASAEYRRTSREPLAEGPVWEAWHAKGPQCPAGAKALLVMSPSEQARVRLFAFWSGSPGVAINYGMLSSLDVQGRRLVTDWCQAVQAYTR